MCNNWHKHCLTSGFVTSGKNKLLLLAFFLFVEEKESSPLHGEDRR